MQEAIIYYLPTFVFLFFLFLSFVIGYRIGFLGKVLSFISFILAIFLARLFTPMVSDMINNATGFNKAIGSSVSAAISNSDIIKQLKEIPNISSIGKVTEMPDLSSIPELKNIPNLPKLSGIPFLKNGFDFSNFEKSIAEIGTNVGNSIINIICGILLFIAILIVLKILSKALKSINSVPIVGTLNKFLGGVLGVLQTVLVFWVIFAIFKALENFPEIAKFTSYVESAPIVGSVYQNNMVYDFFANLFTQVITSAKN